MVDNVFEHERLLQIDIKDKVQELINALNEGNVPTARSLIGVLAQIKEESIYQELGKLTRELHDTITEIDVGITENEIPDARIRLNDVIKLTENAANKTMDGIEATIPMSNNLAAKAKELLVAWDKFKRKELDTADLDILNGEVVSFLMEVEQTSSTIHKHLQDILVAQNYQDLSGQAIKKVMHVVAKVERKLVKLVAIAAEVNNCFADAGVPTVESLTVEKSAKEEQDSKVISSQDEVDDLLSSLGF